MDTVEISEISSGRISPMQFTLQTAQLTTMRDPDENKPFHTVSTEAVAAIMPLIKQQKRTANEIGALTGLKDSAVRRLLDGMARDPGTRVKKFTGKSRRDPATFWVA